MRKVTFLFSFCFCVIVAVAQNTERKLYSIAKLKLGRMPAVQFFAKMENNRQDDGSLAFLQIEPDANNKHFNCSEITAEVN